MKKKPAYITPDCYIYRLALMKASQRCKLLSLGSDETVAFLCFYMLLTWIYKSTVRFQNCSQARAGVATLEVSVFNACPRITSFNIGSRPSPLCTEIYLASLNLLMILRTTDNEIFKFFAILCKKTSVYLSTTGVKTPAHLYFWNTEPVCNVFLYSLMFLSCSQLTLFIKRCSIAITGYSCWGFSKIFSVWLHKSLGL